MRTKVMLLVLGVVLVAAGQTVHTLDPGGIQPLYLVAADLNHDGFPDLAVACHSSNSVAVFENTRTPCMSFNGAVQWKLGDSPVALAAGSFLDPVCPTVPHCFPYTTVFPNLVAVTQYQPGLVRFSPVETKEPFLKLVPGGPLAVAVLPFTTLTHLVVADFNNDGATDVAVLDGISMKIGIFLGARAALLPAVPAQGSAVRPPDKVINLDGEQAYFLGAADFDRDGVLDLVVAVDGNLVFFPGNGEAPTKVKLGKKLVNFALADFNRDGYVDVAVVDPEFAALTVVFNRGCWQFERGPRLKFDGQPVAVVAADFDRNGFVDLAVAEKEANRVSLIINELSTLGEIKRPDPCTHSVTPPEKVDYVGFKIVQVIEVGRGPVALVAEDFDLNGMPDLAVALFTENKVQIIYNPSLCPDCAGKIPCAIPTPAQRSEVAPAAGGGESPKFEATPSPNLNLVVTEGPIFDLSRSDMNLLAAGDLNGDKKIDVILGSTNSETIILFQGDKDGTLLAKGDVRIGLIPEKLLLADLDGNGLADLIAISWRQAQAVVLWSRGSFLFEPVSFFGLPPKVKDVLALRLTDSAREELVLLTDGGPLVWSIPQRGGIVEWAAVPSSLSALTPLPSSLYAYAAWGSSPIATVSYSNNPGELLFALGTNSLGSFRVAQGGAIRAIAVADVNEDGFLDVLGLEEVGRIRVWLVNGGK